MLALKLDGANVGEKFGPEIVDDSSVGLGNDDDDDDDDEFDDDNLRSFRATKHPSPRAP